MNLWAGGFKDIDMIENDDNSQNQHWKTTIFE